MADFSNRMISENNFQTHQLLASNTLYSLRPNFNGIELKSAVEQTLNDYRKTQICPVWILGSEETSRVSSKFQCRAIALQIVQLLMPGTKFIYYGEEIEMTNHPQISFPDTRGGQRFGPV
jgi:glycosidase